MIRCNTHHRSTIYIPAFKQNSTPDLPYFLSNNTSAVLRRLTAKALLDSLDLASQMTSETFWDKIALLNEEQYQYLTILIFRKDPSQRKVLELEFLERMMHNFPFFQDIRSKISLESYNELFKEFRYESYSKGTPLFNYGEEGKKFYLIISGEVYVLIPKSKNKLFIEQTSNLMKNKQSLQSKFTINIPKELIEMTEEHKLLERFPNMQLINVLKEGNLFGEISLSLNEPRTATVVCKEDCSFGVLKAHSYERILKNNYEIELKFLKQTSLFQGFSLQNIAILKGYVQELSLGKEHVLYRQNEEADKIFIIKEGEVELIRMIDEDSEQDGKNPMKIKTNRKKKFSIGKLGVRETFGEEEIFLEKPRLCKAVVSSFHAKILTLSKENLFQNLKSLKSLNSIQKHFNIKFKWRNNQLKAIEHMLEKENQNQHENTTLRNKVDLKTIFNSENKAKLLESLSLKHLQPKKNENGTFYLYFPKKKQKDSNENKSRNAISEEKEKKMGNFEVSRILKMCAVSTSLSKLEKRKRKFAMPNVKLMISNYENEIKKNIQNSIFKNNGNMSFFNKKNIDYLQENRRKFDELEENSVLFESKKEHKKKMLIKSLGIKDIDGYLLKKEGERESRKEKSGFFSQRNRKENTNEEKGSFFCFPLKGLN